jgi:hypothetical protein
MMAAITFNVSEDVRRDLEEIATGTACPSTRWCAAASRSRSTPPADLAQHARRYAAGEISWRDIRDATGATFGDLLVELATQRLQLPQVSVQRTPEQQRAFEEILTRAAQHGPERQR